MRSWVYFLPTASSVTQFTRFHAHARCGRSLAGSSIRSVDCLKFALNSEIRRWSSCVEMGFMGFGFYAREKDAGFSVAMKTYVLRPYSSKKSWVHKNQ